jgi:hypothetical protein
MFQNVTVGWCFSSLLGARPFAQLNKRENMLHMTQVSSRHPIATKYEAPNACRHSSRCKSDRTKYGASNVYGCSVRVAPY